MLQGGPPVEGGEQPVPSAEPEGAPEAVSEEAPASEGVEGEAPPGLAEPTPL